MSQSAEIAITHTRRNTLRCKVNLKFLLYTLLAQYTQSRCFSNTPRMCQNFWCGGITAEASFVTSKSITILSKERALCTCGLIFFYHKNSLDEQIDDQFICGRHVLSMFSAVTKSELEQLQHFRTTLVGIICYYVTAEEMIPILVGCTVGLALRLAHV